MAYQNMYLGFMMIYRAEDDEGYFHGPIFVELVSSRDGVHWLREEGTARRFWSAAPSARGSWHGVRRLIGGGRDEMRLYYSGYDGLHDYLPFHSAIGLATLRKDGFVSLDGEDNRAP